MMSRVGTSSTGSTNVVPFRTPNTAVTNEEYLGNPSNQFGSEETDENLKSIIEAAMFEAYMRAKITIPQIDDDPFDAIYISELRSDTISSEVVENIVKFSNIKDLSETISFNDEWED